MVLNLTLQPLPPHFVQEGAFDPPARQALIEGDETWQALLTTERPQ